MTRKAETIYNNHRGFSLIEIIAALVIMGALGALGTVTLVRMVESYQFAKDNAHLSQKAQVALTRISAELNHATEDVKINGDRIRYDAEYPDGSESTRNLIGVQGGQTVLRLSVDNNPLAQGYILADNITGFEVSRSNSHLIDIELRMEGENEVEQTFTTSIAHR